MFPLNYIEPVYRPPSEADSLILQVTNGCSWNNCTFCELYTQPQKKFKPKAQSEIEIELSQVSESELHPRRIFLADGDAMALSFRRLREILLSIKKYLPNIQRVSAYCLPRNLKSKTIDQLSELRLLGLSLLYIGCESGDDTVLDKVCKGETYASSLVSLTKIKESGMKSSIMILNGLGGQKYTEQHAINSARLVNQAQPNFLASLVVSFPNGEERLQQGFDGDFTPLTQRALFEEIRLFISHLALNKTIFRSDHASNYLILKGVLNKDKDRLIAEVDQAIYNPSEVGLRSEWQRGL